MFLHPVPQRKPIRLDGGLEDVEAAIQNDLPAGVGDDVPSVRGAGRVEGPGEGDPGALTRSRYRFQELALPCEKGPARAGPPYRQMNCLLSLQGLILAYRPAVA